ncbi:CopG family transcriptional regulator [bacterium]|nr:CopG family transcriptional regulator [bacterium]MBU1753651.1 CopG family transcriptional regulator [bacterium]
MKKQIKYTDEPIGELRIVKDFLPPPQKLALKEDNIKVTISLSKSSIEFFKDIAKKQATPYQKMIRNILDFYAIHYQQTAILGEHMKNSSNSR